MRVNKCPLEFSWDVSCTDCESCENSPIEYIYVLFSDCWDHIVSVLLVSKQLMTIGIREFNDYMDNCLRPLFVPVYVSLRFLIGGAQCFLKISRFIISSLSFALFVVSFPCMISLNQALTFSTKRGSQPFFYFLWSSVSLGVVCMSLVIWFGV